VNGWAARYIGEPWVSGENDCWHFARKVWAEVFDRSVPAITIDATDPRAGRQALSDRSGWQEVAQPIDGDAVLMARNRLPCHVGVWVAPRGVLHAVEASGVVFTPDPAVMGYRIVGFYRPESECKPSS
jgi:hypothetical protein